MIHIDRKKFFGGLLVGLIIFLNLKHINCSNIIGVILLTINIYSLIKFRKNSKIFFIFLWILYCNYSFLVSKYFSSTPTFANIWKQISYSDTMMIGVSAVTIFNIIIVMFFSNRTNKKDEITIEENNDILDMVKSQNKVKKYDFIIISIIVIISIVLFDYFIFNFFSFSRQIYEYLLIFFIFGFYFAKLSRNKIYRYILFMLMIFSTVYNTIDGARIISLQPMIAYFFIFFENRINYKNISIAFVAVVIIFTFFGLYGDFLDDGISMDNLTFKYLFDKIIERKFTLDTSIAAYWAGLTFIECRNFIDFGTRFSNFINYITKYLILGTKSNYTQVYETSRNYYLHYYGGYITSYFYYWLGWSGVIFVSLIVSGFLRIIHSLKDEDSNFKKVLSIYIIATIPRWYLYYPTPLFRGIFVFCILYFIYFIILNREKIKIRKINYKTKH